MRASLVGCVIAMALMSSGCDHDEARALCRVLPEECNDGEAGAFCDRDVECQGFCCTENDNCGGGMCTFECDSDRDCPLIMGCEHGMCFYLCDVDDDCAAGQTCEHGQTVCEY